jgi:hypothetical protein
VLPHIKGVAGVMLITGSVFKVMAVALVPVPVALTTDTVPVVAVDAGIAVIDVALTTVKDAADTPLNLTSVAEVKLVPVSVTAAPVHIDVGVKLVTVGTCAMVTAVSSTQINVAVALFILVRADAPCDALCSWVVSWFVNKCFILIGGID